MLFQTKSGGYGVDSMKYFMMSSKTLNKNGKKVDHHFAVREAFTGFFMVFFHKKWKLISI
ncbi:MAG: hypothetical protein ACLFRG_12805 [Desulfococcaceae bacterium]